MTNDELRAIRDWASRVESFNVTDRTGEEKFGLLLLRYVDELRPRLDAAEALLQKATGALRGGLLKEIDAFLTAPPCNCAPWIVNGETRHELACASLRLDQPTLAKVAQAVGFGNGETMSDYDRKRTEEFGE